MALTDLVGLLLLQLVLLSKTFDRCVWTAAVCVRGRLRRGMAPHMAAVDCKHGAHHLAVLPLSWLQ